MLHNQIEPFLFRAEDISSAGSVTACLYFNDAWISQLPEFVKRWNGPISAVYEAVDSKENARDKLVHRLDALRTAHPLIRSLVDFHIVYCPHASELHHNRTLERLIVRPIGTNFQLNLARLFATTEIVWLVSDARMLPSPGLRLKLNNNEDVRKLLLDQADGLVIPLFGVMRHLRKIPNLTSLREDLGYGIDGDGVGADEFEELALAYTSGHYDSLPMPVEDWPHSSQALAAGVFSSAEPYVPSETNPPLFAMYDRSWDIGKGPTNPTRWSKTFATPNVKNIEHTTNKELNPRSAFYEVTEYDLHYSPSLVIGKDRQPWCTERFEYNRAVCTYQMYLQGDKMWVMPDEWAFTLEPIEKGSKDLKNESDRLKVS